LCGEDDQRGVPRAAEHGFSTERETERGIRGNHMDLTNPRHVRSPMVGVVVAAHAPIGSALVAAAHEITGHDDTVVVIDLSRSDDHHVAFERVRAAVAEADQGEGVLLLADLFGGSAANIALAQLDRAAVEVVTGLNLAMLLEALEGQRARHAVHALADRCADAARASIVVAADLLDARSKSGERRLQA
jgi:PTS system mannose-specific IIA component